MTEFTPCEYLEWDSDFFGKRIGRVDGANGLYGTWRQWAFEHGIDCLYLLLPTASENEIAFAQRANFTIVDERITVARPMSDRIPETADVEVRLAEDGDLPRLMDIASTVHTATRFYSDPNFDIAKCSEMYRIWIEKHFASSPIITADLDGAPVGYVGYTVDGDVGHLSLVGVAEEGRNKGYATALVTEALRRIRDAGCTKCTVVTQGGNAIAMALYTRAGFDIRYRDTWLHWWQED